MLGLTGRMLSFPLSNPTGALAHQACAKALETTVATVANHLILLEQANLLCRLPPSGLGGKRVLKARNKYNCNYAETD